MGNVPDATTLRTWSIPCRVIRVYRSGYVAFCKNLLLNEVYDVHLRNARLISKPLTEVQKTLWNVELGEELVLCADEEEKQKILQKFWTQMNTAIDTNEDLSSMARKRRMSQNQVDAQIMNRQREDPEK